MAVLETQPAPQKAPESATAEPRKKLFGRKFYESIGSPKYIVAPMVDRSEFVWPMPLLFSASGLTIHLPGLAHADSFVHATR
jgi:hypothetical protein